jgi:hypothetical protein
MRRPGHQVMVERPRGIKPSDHQTAKPTRTSGVQSVSRKMAEWMVYSQGNDEMVSSSNAAGSADTLSWSHLALVENQMVVEIEVQCRSDDSTDLMRRLLIGYSLRLEERDRRGLANSLGKVKGIPIGKSNAAMGPGFADLFRVAGSMNSVGRLVQIDPDQADRVVGTGCDDEVSIGSRAFELELRVVVIGGLLDNPANAVSAALDISPGIIDGKPVRMWGRRSLPSSAHVVSRRATSSIA